MKRILYLALLGTATVFTFTGTDAAKNASFACQDRGVIGSIFNHWSGTCLGDNGDNYMANGGTFRPAQPSAPAPAPVVMGNLCASPIGVFPGPWNPVGMQCNGVDPWGRPFVGTVVQ
jgi:hypothetical protein